jgi:hypothetical protein
MYDQAILDKCLELILSAKEDFRALKLQMNSQLKKMADQLPLIFEKKELPTPAPVVKVTRTHSAFNEQTIALIKDSEKFTNVTFEQCHFMKYMCSSLRYCPTDLILSFAPTTLCIAQKLTFDLNLAANMEFDPNDNKLLKYLIRIFTFL